MWRMHKLRPDFYPAEKVQVEDDITASVVVPRERVRILSPEQTNHSVKIVQNCEEYLFQRPDDAIYRGFDAQAEADLATPGTFITNFEPLSVARAAEHGSVGEARSFYAAHEGAARRFRTDAERRIRGFVGSPANGRR